MKEALISVAVLGPAGEQVCKFGTRKGSRFAQVLLTAQAGDREGDKGKQALSTDAALCFPLCFFPFL